MATMLDSLHATNFTPTQSLDSHLATSGRGERGSLDVQLGVRLAECHMGATGVRKSRRLGALTESDSAGWLQSATQAAQSHDPPAASAAATAAAGLADRQKAQQHAGSHQSQSHPLLQASTLEASANVLKGLVTMTGTTCFAVIGTTEVNPVQCM